MANLFQHTGHVFNQIESLINTKEAKVSVSSESAVRSAAGHLGLLLAAPVNAQKAMNSI
jgi:hypothetical protein